MRRRDVLLRAVIGAAGAAAPMALWALVIGPRRTVVRRVTLRLPGWPDELDGVRIALVGDLHAGVPHVDVDRVARVATRIAERHPDLVLLAGDLMDDDGRGARRLDPRDVAAALATAGAPRLAVLGNHDRIFGERAVVAALDDAGFALLENEAVAIPIGDDGHRLWIAGVSDAHSSQPDPSRALAPVPHTEPVLVLTHSPDVFPRIPARAALTLAGHTHGGQVAAPRPLRARMIPSRFGTRYARGHVVEGGRHLYVTSGIGTSGWPIRLGVAPEVVLLRLRPARPARARPGRATR